MTMIDLDQEVDDAVVAPQEDKVQQLERKGESDLLFPFYNSFGCSIAWSGAVLMLVSMIVSMYTSLCRDFDWKLA
jgi:hypothetical protein